MDEMNEIEEVVMWGLDGAGLLCLMGSHQRVPARE